MSQNERDPALDDELMVRLAAGDLDALAVLVQRHQRLAWSVAFRFCGERSAAEDIVSDTFLSLLDNANRYRPRGRFVSYLLRVLTNRAISYGRRPRPAPLLDTDLADPSEDAGGALDRHAQEARVRHALSRLPERQRLALILRFYEELPCDEIAAAMDASTKSVERLLARGRETLARWLQNV